MTEHVEDHPLYKPPLPWHLMEGRIYHTGCIYVTGTHQVLTNVHPPENCEGHHCVIHAPSRHPLVYAPTHWRVRTEFDPHDFEHVIQVMERICPCGVFHPDPVDVAVVTRTKGDEWGFVGAHECCEKGCCHE